MNKTSLYAVVAVIMLIGGYFYLMPSFFTEAPAEQPAVTFKDYKNTAYTIDGKSVLLINGLSEAEVAPGSASKVTTRYFGNELRKDLNNDGKPDVVFLVTQSIGGSGTFFYAVVALAVDGGYAGSDGYLLGDRIAPQTTESGPGNSVIINYADRNPGEAFTVSPSLGKSARLILDTATMRWGIVAQNFEGEADPSRMSLDMKTWNWIKATYNDGRIITPNKPNVFSITFKKDGTFSIKTDCNSMGGTYKTSAGKITFGPISSTEMYCEGSQESTFAKLIGDTTGYLFTSKGELVFDLKLDSGTVIFR